MKCSAVHPVVAAPARRGQRQQQRGGTVKHLAWLGAAWWLGFPLAAEAACPKGSPTVFACLSGQGKRIQVCDAGRTLDYSFGRPGSPPEITLRVPRRDAATFQWAGVGRYLSYTVELPNGNTLYRVFWGADRLTEAHAVEAGVHVEVNQRLVATVRCVGERHIVQNIEGIDLKPAD
ncbi:MAG: hypothetical protein C0445_15980 [Polaromonas sp.]|nr:hypothetical protein [Polaromonas sp.]